MEKNELMLTDEPVSNDSNLEFYDKIEIEKFKEFTQITGFDTCPDLEILFPILENRKRIVELGAGYGRVVKCLLNKGYQGQIYAVERVTNFVQYMNECFGPNKNVEVLHQDIKKLRLPQTVDTVLWMWSSVMEMSPDELLTSIRNLRSQVEDKTLVAIELPNKKIKVVGEYESEKVITLKTNWGTLRAYFPEEAEIFIRTKKAKFSPVDTIFYETDKCLQRVIYLFEAV